MGFGIHLEAGHDRSRGHADRGAERAFDLDFLILVRIAPRHTLEFPVGVRDGRRMKPLDGPAAADIQISAAQSQLAGRRAGEHRGASFDLRDIGDLGPVHVRHAGFSHGGVLEDAQRCDKRISVECAVDHGAGSDLEFHIRGVIVIIDIRGLQCKRGDGAAAEDGDPADGGDFGAAYGRAARIDPFAGLFVLMTGVFPDGIRRSPGGRLGRETADDAALINDQAALDGCDVDRGGPGVDRAPAAGIGQAAERIGRERNGIHDDRRAVVAAAGSDDDLAAVFLHVHHGGAVHGAVPGEARAHVTALIHGHIIDMGAPFDIHGSARIDDDAGGGSPGADAELGALVQLDVVRDGAVVELQEGRGDHCAVQDRAVRNDHLRPVVPRPGQHDAVRFRAIVVEREAGGFMHDRSIDGAAVDPGRAAAVDLEPVHFVGTGRESAARIDDEVGNGRAVGCLDRTAGIDRGAAEHAVGCVDRTAGIDHRVAGLTVHGDGHGRVIRECGFDGGAAG